MAKVQLKDLIEKKEQLKNKTPKRAEIFVKSLNGTVTIEAPSVALAKDAQGMDDGDDFIVYNCVVDPNLKDKKLQEEFGTALPLEIVQAIFEPGEIPQVAIECLKLSGYIEGVKVVDTLKN